MIIFVRYKNDSWSLKKPDIVFITINYICIALILKRYTFVLSLLEEQRTWLAALP